MRLKMIIIFDLYFFNKIVICYFFDYFINHWIIILLILLKIVNLIFIFFFQRILFLCKKFCFKSSLTLLNYKLVINKQYCNENFKLIFKKNKRIHDYFINYEQRLYSIIVI